MKALISMTDFVLEKINPENFGSSDIRKILNYANFLKQPLKLEMFVPCDDEGNVLDEPDYGYIGTPRMIQYEKAKEKVLFEGFEIKGNYLMYDGFRYSTIYELEGKAIESIIDEIPRSPLQLTTTALKQIGL